jgi:Rrf2 family iron-sulfur cluster assembly transcriptional regulator
VRLSTKARYAVMAMADLAAREGARPVALAEVAARQDISLSYLEQLFSKLRRARLVRSVRGPGGGYLLARPAPELRIAEIILAVEEPIRATRCRPDSPAGCLPGRQRCLTHDLWEELERQIYLFLNAVSLDDVVAGRVLGMSGLRAPDDAPETKSTRRARAAERQLRAVP